MDVSTWSDAPWWVASTIACLVVTLVCQLLVAALYLLLRHQRRLATFAEISVMGLGVGTMVADAMMHLIPHAAGGGHSHGPMGVGCAEGDTHCHSHHHHHEGDAHFWQHLDGVLLGLSAIGGMIFVVMLEMFVHSVQHGDHDHSHGHSHSAKKADGGSHCCSHSAVPKDSRKSLSARDYGSHGNNEPLEKAADLRADSLEGCLHRRSEANCEANHHHHHGFAHLFDEPDTKLALLDSSDAPAAARTSRSSIASTSRQADQRGGRMFAASMVYVAAKIVHDVIDGFTIGIAFNSGISAGIATSVCILAHELPMQFADFVILRKGGFSPWKAGGINLAVSLFLLPGALLAGFGRSETLTRHLLMATAGNFLCLAFSQLIPEIRETILDLESKGSSKKFVACAVVSAAVGVVCIAILGIFEGLT